MTAKKARAVCSPSSQKCATLLGAMERLLVTPALKATTQTFAHLSGTQPGPQEQFDTACTRQ